jgi:hypothetical protein
MSAQLADVNVPSTLFDGAILGSPKHRSLGESENMPRRIDLTKIRVHNSSPTSICLV